MAYSLTEKNALSYEDYNKTSLLTCISPLVYPVDKGTDSGEHSEVVGPTVLVPPTHRTTKNPSAAFVAHERSATVSLRSKTNLIDKIVPLVCVRYQMVDIANEFRSILYHRIFN